MIHEAPEIRGVKLARLTPHPDGRGRFLETFRKSWFPERTWEAIQANLSHSRAGVLRGLHYHLAQIDFWVPVEGRARVGLYDLRKGSPTRGRRLVLEMDAENPVGIFVPTGVAHGFYAVTGVTLAYLVDAYHDGSDEHGVAWDDPDIAIPWKAADPVLSDRDRGNPRLRNIPSDRLPA